MWNHIRAVRNNKNTVIIILLGVILLLAINSFIEASDSKLHVSFLDVGQGDSIYIRGPGHGNILIDGGPGKEVLRSLASQETFDGGVLDYVIATHSDSDHVAGLLEVCRKYKIRTLLHNSFDLNKDYMQSLLKCIDDQAGSKVMVGSGDGLDLGGGAVLSFLSPSIDDIGSVSILDNNSSSIVSMLSYGSHKFLLMADSPRSVERDISLRYRSEIEKQVTVLKAGHHGSDTSSSEEFIKLIRPTYTIISAGNDNKYGHPMKSVIDILRQYSEYIITTQVSGSINFISDGKNLEVLLQK